MIDRRDFLKTVSAATPIALWGPSLFAATAAAGSGPTPNWDRILVMVELKGGNDGLNTVAPFADPLYPEFRPNLSMNSDQVLKLDEKLGLHPALSGLYQSWRQDELAVALGCGYDNPNRSHFRSIDIWHTAANSDEYMGEGWLTRMLRENQPPAEYMADGIVLGQGDPGPMRGHGIRSIVMKNPQEFIDRGRDARQAKDVPEQNALAHVLGVENDLARAVRDMREKIIAGPELITAFPTTGFGQQMETTAKLITAGIPFAAIKVAQGGYDTHAGQTNRHQQLLGELNAGIVAFKQAMQELNMWDKVLLMTYSEFGRRVKENGSIGTDHGTSAPHFLMGGKVKGGLYGAQPALSDLRGDGDLKHSLDYRCIYETVSKHWWNLGDNFANAKNKVRPLDCIKA
ncbi:MAG: DUF1501 domain-containing protein [Verrucomicrobia bacterium]|nr:DUF1501 domain-containing protein [Verrucomicrobiota bacterium]MDA1088672.1 DUF1501 domain-containing protein [Verrucomicrobiota bacterium]